MQAATHLPQPDLHDDDLHASTNKKRKLTNAEYDQELMNNDSPAQDPSFATGSSHGLADGIADVQHAGDIDIARAQGSATDVSESQHANLDDASARATQSSGRDGVFEVEAGAGQSISEDIGSRSTPPASAPSTQKNVKSASKSARNPDRVSRELLHLLDDSTISFSPRGSARGNADGSPYNVEGVRRAAAIHSSSPYTPQIVQEEDVISMTRPKKDSGTQGSSTLTETGGLDMETGAQADAYYEETGKAKKSKASGGAKKLSTTKTKNASGVSSQAGEPFDPSFTMSGKSKKSSKSRPTEDPNKVYTEEELAARAITFAKKSASSKAAWERKKAALAAYEAVYSPAPQLASSPQSQTELSVPSQAAWYGPADDASNDGSDTAFQPAASKLSKNTKAKAVNAKGQAKSSNKSKKKKAASPAASDASSIPMLALHSADGTVSNFDDARLNIGASYSKRKSKSQLQQQQLAPPTPPLPEEEEEEIDDRLYCICQEPYDPDKIMIACDRCDEWYHISCIGLSEGVVELVDRFICPACEAALGEKTTHRAACARQECGKAALKHSKYCSDWCGLSVAASRLDLHRDQIDSGKLWNAVEGSQRQEAFVTVLLPDGSVPDHHVKTSAYNTEQELHSLSTSLDQLVVKRMSIEAQHSVVEYRLRYLGLALQRWQRSCAAFKETMPVQPSKKNKTKSGATASAADGPCGFDVRLVWEDRDFATWVDSDSGRRVFAAESQVDETESEGIAIETVNDEEEEGLVCSLSRKKCERHTGWQKMREADYEVEKSVLSRRLGDLAKKERQLRRRVEDISDLLRWQQERSAKASEHVPTLSQTSPAASKSLETPNNVNMDGEMTIEEIAEEVDDIMDEVA